MKAEMNPTTHPIGSVLFTSTDLKAAADLVLDSSPGQKGRHIHLLNAYSVSLAHQDSSYRAAVGSSAINFPDGKPVAWVSRLRGDQRPLTQIRGVRLFLSCFEHGTSRGTKHFLLGSTPSTLDLLASELRSRYPNARIVGTFSPPFRALSDDEFAAQDLMIADTEPDVVWVGLGTPKQDFEVLRLSQSLDVTAVAIGAAFDFVAGTVKEAPEWMSRIGFEWLFRLLTEPRRLWRRYLIGNAVFIRAVLCRKRCPQDGEPPL